MNCCAARGDQHDPDIIQHRRSGAVIHVHRHADISCPERAAHQAAPPARRSAHQWASHHHQLWRWLARWHSDHRLERHRVNSAQIHCPWHLQSHGKICRCVQFHLSGYPMKSFRPDNQYPAHRYLASLLLGTLSMRIPASAFSRCRQAPSLLQSQTRHHVSMH